MKKLQHYTFTITPEERIFKYKYQSICFSSDCSIYKSQGKLTKKNETQVGCRVMPFNFFI